MIATEAEYDQAIAELNNLKSQYAELSPINRKRPYIGQQMAREIHRLTSDTKLYEYNRFEKFVELTPDKH